MGLVGVPWSDSHTTQMLVFEELKQIRTRLKMTIWQRKSIQARLKLRSHLNVHIHSGTALLLNDPQAKLCNVRNSKACFCL